MLKLHLNVIVTHTYNLLYSWSEVIWLGGGEDSLRNCNLASVLFEDFEPYVWGFREHFCIFLFVWNCIETLWEYDSKWQCAKVLTWVRI